MNTTDKEIDLIEVAYENYVNKIKLQNNWEVTLRVMNVNTIGHQELLSKEEFVNKCKTDEEFSKRWDITIETRELSHKERIKLSWPISFPDRNGEIIPDWWNIKELSMDEQNIPTKLTTINYNGQIQEYYE